MNTRHEKDQLSAAHYDRKWKEIIAQMPQGGDYCFYMRQYGYDIVKNIIKPGSLVFDYACGLGIIDAQLTREKKCLCYGCDISKIAVEYFNEQVGSKKAAYIGDLITPSPIKNKPYDYVLAIYFLEHISDPIRWIGKALAYGQRVIFSIPNNFKRAGEHALMKWDSWDSFYDLFADYYLTRMDEGKYHKWLPAAYHHPTFICEKK